MLPPPSARAFPLFLQRRLWRKLIHLSLRQIPALTTLPCRRYGLDIFPLISGSSFNVSPIIAVAHGVAGTSLNSPVRLFCCHFIPGVASRGGVVAGVVGGCNAPI